MFVRKKKKKENLYNIGPAIWNWMLDILITDNLRQMKSGYIEGDWEKNQIKKIFMGWIFEQWQSTKDKGNF